MRKAIRPDENAPEPGSEPPVSKEEREGVPPTDTSAATPLGVGESTSQSGEDVAKGSNERGRQDTGTQGQTERPTGTSTDEDVTGVNPGGGSG